MFRLSKLRPRKGALYVGICKSISVLLLIAFSQAVLSNGFSPYSPAYIVSPYDVLSTSSYNNSWNKSRLYDFSDSYGSSNPSASFKSTDINFQQALTIGLPLNYEAGFSLSYADNVYSSSPRINKPVGELGNPNFFINKFWATDTQLWGKASLQVSPKTGDTGLKAAPTAYQIGLSGIYVPDDALVATLGITQTIVDPIYAMTSNSTSINGILSKTFGSYLLNLGLSVRRYDPWLATNTNSGTAGGGTYSNNGQDSAKASFLYNGGFDLSKQVLRNTWFGIGYNVLYQNRSYNYNSSGSYSGPDINYSWNSWGNYKANTVSNILTLSIKATF